MHPNLILEISQSLSYGGQNLRGKREGCGEGGRGGEEEEDMEREGEEEDMEREGEEEEMEREGEGEGRGRRRESEGRGEKVRERGRWREVEDLLVLM